jgi:hypothetical protein
MITVVRSDGCLLGLPRLVRSSKATFITRIRTDLTPICRLAVALVG